MRLRTNLTVAAEGFVIDLIVADISLVVTKRSEFNSMLKKVENNLSKFNEVLFDQNQISYQKITE